MIVSALFARGKERFSMSAEFDSPMAHLLGLGGGAARFARDGWNRAGVIDVIEPNVQSTIAAKGDHTTCHVGRDRLPPLVMAYVSLRAADAIRKHLLRDIQL